MITHSDRTAINSLNGVALWGSRVGPLRPAPAHSQMSLRDGMNVRLRGGIQIPAARFSEAWENLFGEKRFAKIAGFERFGSSRGVRDGAPRG